MTLVWKGLQKPLVSYLFPTYECRNSCKTHLVFTCNAPNDAGTVTVQPEWWPSWRWDVSNTTKEVIRGGKIKPDITALLMFHLPRWSLILPNLRSISMHSMHGPFWTCEFPYLKMEGFQNCPMLVCPSGFVPFQPIFELWRSKSGSPSAPSAPIPWYEISISNQKLRHQLTNLIHQPNV